MLKIKLKRIYLSVAVIVIIGMAFAACSPTKQSSIEKIVPETVNEISMTGHVGHPEYFKVIQVTNKEDIDFIVETLETGSWVFMPNWDWDWALSLEIIIDGNDSKSTIGLFDSGEGYAVVTVENDTSITEHFQIPDTIFDEMQNFLRNSESN